MGEARNFKIINLASWNHLTGSTRKFITINADGLSRLDVLTSSTFNMTHYATLVSGVRVITGQNTGNTANVALGIVSNTDSWVYYSSATVAGKQVTLKDGADGVDVSVDVTNYTGNYYIGMQMLSGHPMMAWFYTLYLYGRVYQ